MRKRSNSTESPITVLGLGHIGLPTALGLADLGWNVIGADDDAKKVGLIRSGDPIFFEPGPLDLLTKHLKSGKFKPVDDVDAAVRAASIIFICVGTPQKASGQADLAQVEAVARVVARNLNGYKLIVEKSTVPAITAQWLKRTIVRYSVWQVQWRRGHIPVRIACARGIRHRFQSRIPARRPGGGGFLPPRPHRVRRGFRARAQDFDRPLHASRPALL